MEAGYAFKLLTLDCYNLALNMYEGVPISGAVKPWRWRFTVLARVAWMIRVVVVPLYIFGPQVRRRERASPCLVPLAHFGDASSLVPPFHPPFSSSRQVWLPCILGALVTGGAYLAFFFLMSHNFEGVYHVLDDRLVRSDQPLEEGVPNTLLRHQVRAALPLTSCDVVPLGCASDCIHPLTLCVSVQVLTSSNVAGPVLAFFNGGLNYQVRVLAM